MFLEELVYQEAKESRYCQSFLHDYLHRCFYIVRVQKGSKVVVVNLEIMEYL